MGGWQRMSKLIKRRQNAPSLPGLTILVTNSPHSLSPAQGELVLQFPQGRTVTVLEGTDVT